MFKYAICLILTSVINQLRTHQIGWDCKIHYKHTILLLTSALVPRLSLASLSFREGVRMHGMNTNTSCTDWKRWIYMFWLIYCACRGGVGVETSAAYIDSEFERIFYKLNYGFRIALQNLYMVSIPPKKKVTSFFSLLWNVQFIYFYLDIWRDQLG